MNIPKLLYPFHLLPSQFYHEHKFCTGLYNTNGLRVNSVAHLRNDYIPPPKGNTSPVSLEAASYLLLIQEHVISMAGLEASRCRCQFLEEGDNLLR